MQKQAENILLEAEQNKKLHHVACNFVKQPGHIYHLYKQESGQFYFSMLSPEVNITCIIHTLITLNICNFLYLVSAYSNAYRNGMILKHRKATKALLD